MEPGAGPPVRPSKILLDPYARAIGGRDVWGVAPDWDNVFPHRGRVVFDDFDWEGDRPLETPIEDLVIYEAHVRGFTRDPSSGVRFPGTFGGIREKIPYLKELGINCLELLPIFEFDEFENSRTHPDDRRAAAELLGLQHRRLLRAQGRLRRHRASSACRSTS